MPVQVEPPRIQTREQRPAIAPPERVSAKAKVVVRDLNFFYGKVQALHNISLEIPERIVMAFKIGRASCRERV